MTRAPGSISQTTCSSSPRPSSSTDSRVRSVWGSVSPGLTAGAGSVLGTTSLTIQCRDRTLTSCPCSGTDLTIVLKTCPPRFSVPTACYPSRQVGIPPVLNDRDGEPPMYAPDKPATSKFRRPVDPSRMHRPIGSAAAEALTLLITLGFAWACPVAPGPWSQDCSAATSERVWAGHG